MVNCQVFSFLLSFLLDFWSSIKLISIWPSKINLIVSVSFFSFLTLPLCFPGQCDANESMKCYVCTNIDDPDCNDNPTSDKFIMDCDEFFTNKSETFKPTEKDYFCRKTVEQGSSRNHLQLNWQPYMNLLFSVNLLPYFWHWSIWSQYTKLTLIIKDWTKDWEMITKKLRKFHCSKIL